MVACDDKTHSLCEETLRMAIKGLDPNSPKKLFLEEQLKALSVASGTGRRWHPAVIRWCLLVHRKSKAAYKYIRESGLFALPSERTLNDYRSYKPVVSGVDKAYILDLVKQHGAQDVAVLIDEMKISEGLVYNAATGNLVGFVDSLDENSLLDSVTASGTNATGKVVSASHALCFMVRGLQSKLSAVVATFGTKSCTAEQLYNRFWELTANLELGGFRVRCVVSDGASINRRFYKLHHADFNDDVTYRAINKYAPGRVIYLISDTCHLMKTTRNCVENSGANRNSRRLVVSCKFSRL